MSSSGSRRRIIACVDGTWYDADGSEGNGRGNCSNVFRIFAAIKRGDVVDIDNTSIEQVCEYFSGIGTNRRPLEKFNSGITGDGCTDHIYNVYKYCCRHIRNPQDEVWFYGFSRGAYVVTAVADLLHEFGALAYDEDFDKTYATIVTLYKSLQKGHGMENQGKLFYIRDRKSRKCPRINFLGLLDTVKRVNNDLNPSTHMLSFHSTIKHVRHALALNETRSHFQPEMYGPLSDSDSLEDRSLIQAWFAGAHADIGGGARDDGLSLYPLQWLLIESQHYGLVLEHGPLISLIENPVKLIYPSQSAIDGNPWNYKYANGVEVRMWDLRESHNHGNLQSLGAKKLTKPRPVHDNPKSPKKSSTFPWTGRKKSTDSTDSSASTKRRSSGGPIETRRKSSGMLGRFFNKSTDVLASPTEVPEEDNRPVADIEDTTRHIVRLNHGFPYITFQAVREPFKDGKLQGYNESGQGRFGTIIHPSVYFISDVYARHGIETAMRHFEHDISNFRDEQHPNFRDPWMMALKTAPEATAKACRILVCGRTGVGKSTLINKVFGVPLTIESHMKQGDHDINEAFESDSHPGIIIHDSRGFQAGDANEVDQFRRFIKKRSTLSNPKEALHAIWICIQSDTDRVIQQSEHYVFKILAEYAAHIPIIIVGTKKDRFLNQSESVARRALERDNPDMANMSKESRAMAEQDLQTRQEALKAELGTIPDLDTDSMEFLCVSKDDPESIRGLVNRTLDIIEDDGARLKCIAAQVVDVEPKIAQAIDESMRLLRHGIWASTVGSAALFVSTISTPTISRILCDNILRCFGFPKIDPGSVDNIMNKIIGWNLMRFLAQQVGQSVVLGGSAAILTIVSLGGGVPLIAGMSLLEAPCAARMIVKCACDLILILTRAFKHGGKFVTSSDIEMACNEYVAKPTDGSKAKRRNVHAEVMDLIPQRQFWKGVRIAKIRTGVEEIIKKNRWEPERSAAASLSEPNSSMITRLSSDSLRDEEDAKIMFGKPDYVDLQIDKIAGSFVHQVELQKS